MATITINLWLLAVGAAAGAAAIIGAKGRNALVKGAVIGAVVAFLMGLLKGMM